MRGWVLAGGGLAFLLIHGLGGLMAYLSWRFTRYRVTHVALELAWTVLVEVVRSNNAVARVILAPGRRELKSGFVHVPLDMRDPYGLTALACIVTATPGTVWVEYDSAKGTMLLHVLDLIDEEEWVRIIKDRYERRLMEIFE